MAVETEEIRELVDFVAEGFLVTSFYLDVNGVDFPSPEHVKQSLDSLIHTAESRRKEIEDSLSHEAEASVRDDLARIRSFVTEDFERQDTNGLAIFSCSGLGLWEVIQLPTPVKSEVYFDATPYVTPIATFLSHNKPTAILLTDRKHARIFTMKGSDVREWADFESPMPQRSDQGGWSQSRYQRRADHYAKHHIDEAAELVLRLSKRYPFDWLILGTEVQTESDIRVELHPYVKDRVIGEIHVRLDADPDEIIEQATTVRDEAQARLIDHLMEQIQEYAGAGGRGTIGLEDTLQALNEQKIHIMVVDESYEAAGSRCANCGLLSVRENGACPACGGQLLAVSNLVEDMIQKALELGSTVEVATEPGKLEPIQSIGSIMYY